MRRTPITWQRYDGSTRRARAGFSELIRAYAQRQRAQNLLLSELTRLLEPAPEFTKLAVANLETRNLTAAVVESWKPIVASAINEWAKQHTLTSVLAGPTATSPSPAEPSAPASKVTTSDDEIAAFESVRRLLGPERSIAYEDATAYLKLHLADRRTWVFARLQLGRKVPLLWVPLAAEDIKGSVGARAITANQGWTSVALDSPPRFDDLRGLLVAAYDSIAQAKLSRE